MAVVVDPPLLSGSRLRLSCYVAQQLCPPHRLVRHQEETSRGLANGFLHIPQYPYLEIHSDTR